MAQVCVDVDDLAAPAGYLTISANQSYYYGKNPEGRITLKNITISVPAGENKIDLHDYITYLLFYFSLYLFGYPVKLAWTQNEGLL